VGDAPRRYDSKDNVLDVGATIFDDGADNGFWSNYDTDGDTVTAL
jgi:hypothetical protein